MKRNPKTGLVHVKCKTKYFDYVMNRTKEELREWSSRMDRDITSVTNLLDRFYNQKRVTKEDCLVLIQTIENTLSKWR